MTCTLAGVLTLTVAAWAAGSDAGPSILGRLTVRSGCDETFVARDPQGTLVLVVRVPGILARSRAQRPYREELDVGEAGLAVRLEQGADLDYWCTDMLTRPPRVDVAWVGVSGRATVVLSEPGAQGDTGRGVPAVVHLGPVVLEREGGREDKLTLPGLDLSARLGVPGGG
jgi:hypothetical protein